MSRERLIAALICVTTLLGASACASSAAPVTTHAAGPSNTTTSAIAAPVTTLAVPDVGQTTSTPRWLPLGPKIVITKSARQLDLYSGGVLLHTYRIALGFAPEGDKEREGDGRTPEGEFYVCVKNPESNYRPALGVSYPSKDDAERGLRDGLIDDDEYGRILAAVDAGQAPPMKTALGGEIYIHAGGSQNDWTQGCVGLDEADMRGLYEAVEIGTPIVIRP